MSAPAQNGRCRRIMRFIAGDSPMYIRFDVALNAKFKTYGIRSITMSP